MLASEKKILEMLRREAPWNGVVQAVKVIAPNVDPIMTAHIGKGLTEFTLEEFLKKRCWALMLISSTSIKLPNKMISFS